MNGETEIFMQHSWDLHSFYSIRNMMACVRGRKTQCYVPIGLPLYWRVKHISPVSLINKDIAPWETDTGMA